MIDDTIDLYRHIYTDNIIDVTSLFNIDTN